MLTDSAERTVTESDVKCYLEHLFSSCMNAPVEELGDEDSFFSLGLTSLIHAEVLNNLTDIFGELSSTVLFEYPNFNLLAKYLAEKGPADDAISLNGFSTKA